MLQFKMEYLGINCIVLFVHLAIAGRNFGESDYVPVLIWESTENASTDVYLPAYLTELSSDSFLEIIKKKIRSMNSDIGPVILVFVEESLSIEDFIHENRTRETSFSQFKYLISTAKNVNFFPRVQSPLKSLKTLGYDWQWYNPISKEDIISDQGKGLFIIMELQVFNQLTGNPELSEQSNNQISDIYRNLLLKYPNVIALYTGYTSPAKIRYESSGRKARNLKRSEGDDSCRTIFWHDQEHNIYLYSKTCPVINMHSSDSSQDRNITRVSLSTDFSEGYQKLIAEISLAAGQTIVLRFRFPVTELNYWKLSEIELEDCDKKTLLKTSLDISAPVGLSYHCSHLVVYRNEDITLNFSQIQVQPYVKDKRFGDAYHCVGYFTGGMLGGILIVALLTSITIGGITMIASINNVDRFDDPKGKPLIIATEG